MDFGALKWFGSFVEKLKKALDCINHVIYTCDLIMPLGVALMPIKGEWSWTFFGVKMGKK